VFQDPGNPNAKYQGGANQNDSSATFAVSHGDVMARILRFKFAQIERWRNLPDVAFELEI
jgi:hypothetical protein